MLLTCPKCGKQDPASEIRIPTDPYDKNITCKHCKKLIKGTKWLCPCGSPWFLCSKHDDVAINGQNNQNNSDPETTKTPHGKKRKNISSSTQHAADSSGIPQPKSKLAKRGAATDIETLRNSETKRYKFALSNARSAKRKTLILLGEADLVMPTQLGPILTKRFRRMEVNPSG